VQKSKVEVFIADARINLQPDNRTAPNAGLSPDLVWLTHLLARFRRAPAKPQEFAPRSTPPGPFARTAAAFAGESRFHVEIPRCGCARFTRIDSRARARQPIQRVESCARGTVVHSLYMPSRAASARRLYIN
jgi:hypothetical protein